MENRETSSTAGGRGRAVALVVLGLAACAAYAAWLVSQPRGLAEFSYAPFSPEPLPYSPMRGFTYEQLWGHVVRFVLVTPGLGLVTAGLYRLRPLGAPESFRRLTFGVCAASIAVAAVVMLVVLRGRALTDDELVYRMQATFFSEGRLGSREIGVVPPDVFTVKTLAGYTGKYLPGEGIVQILGVLVGMAPFLHLPLFALTLFAWHRALLVRSGARIADFGTLALALSPMVMLTTATGLSQATSLCMVVLAGLGLEWARSSRPVAGAALLAFAVAFGFATRPQAMLPAGAALVPAAGIALLRARRFTAFGVLAGALGIGFVLVGAYNRALSGSAFTLPWYLQCTIEHYGFGRVWKLDTFEHTPWTALENLAVVAVRLNAWWFGFPCSLLVLVLWLVLGKKMHGSGVWLVVGLFVIVFELGYYSPGVSDTGTAYHYELVLPGALIAASVLDEALRRAQRLTATVVAVHVGLGTLGWLGEQALRLGRQVTAMHEDADRALAQVSERSILFYERRPSERRPLGWIDEFPERFRADDAKVVTFPNLGPEMNTRIERAYPGRACFYYRRDPRTEAAELRRCDTSRELMARSLADEDERPLWVRPTAYLLTDFDPNAANRARRVRGADGRPILPCCTLREFRAQGLEVEARMEKSCVEDGP